MAQGQHGYLYANADEVAKIKDGMPPMEELVDLAEFYKSRDKVR